MIIALLYALTNLLLGWNILNLFIPKNIERRVFISQPILSSSFILGQCILATVWLFLGLLSCFKPILIISILILVLISGLPLSKHLSKLCKKNIIQTYHSIHKLPLLWKLILCVLSCVMGVYGLAALLLPPIGDAEAFYMVLPKVMAASERLKPLTNYYSFSQIGFFGEMHFAALMSIISPQAAKCFAWLTGFAVVSFMLALCAEIGIRARGKIIALVMLFTSSTFTLHLFDGKVEMFATALGLAALYWALQTNKKSANQKSVLLPYLLTGLFCAFACVAKFSYIPVLLSAVFIILVWNHWQILLQLKTLALFSIIGCMFLIGILPHLIKNTVLFNEPFAPFYFFKAGGSNWTEQTWYTKETIRHILLTYPIALTFGKYSLSGGNLSPLVLIFLPLFLLVNREQWKLPKSLGQMIVAAVASLLIWMICRPAVLCPRCILPTLLLFIPMVAWCAEKVYLSKNYTLVKMGMVTSAVVCMCLCFSKLIVPYPNKMLVSKFGNYLKSNYQIHVKKNRWPETADGLNYVNHYSKLGERVFVLGYYTYHLRADLLQCLSTPVEFAYVLEHIEDPWSYLFDAGIKFFVVQDNNSFKVANKPDWLNVSKVYEDQRTKVYALSSNDSLHKPKFATRQNPYPAWEVVSLT